jgi:hypothetical protein
MLFITYYYLLLRAVIATLSANAILILMLYSALNVKCKVQNTITMKYELFVS